MDIFTSKASQDAVICVKEIGTPTTHRGNESTDPVWKPSMHQLAIMICLAIISFMISLDATIIITTLSGG